MQRIDIFEKAVKDKGFRLTRTNLVKNEGVYKVRSAFYDNFEKGIHIFWDAEGNAYVRKEKVKDNENFYLCHNFYGHKIAFPIRDTYWRDESFDLYLPGANKK